MKRRSTVKYLGAAGLVAATGGGYHWLTRKRDHADLAIDRTLERLNELNVGSIETTGAWEVGRTFEHLAQSVEFSMSGYPVMKPDAFRSTVGRLAFSVFQARGHMSHGLDEPIPGERVAAAPAPPDVALACLLDALERFERFEGPLKPHFAYGALDRDEYAIAHAMHVNNHLEEFRNA